MTFSFGKTRKPFSAEHYPMAGTAALRSPLPKWGCGPGSSTWPLIHNWYYLLKAEKRKSYHRSKKSKRRTISLLCFYEIQPNSNLGNRLVEMQQRYICQTFPRGGKTEKDNPKFLNSHQKKQVRSASTAFLSQIAKKY